LTLRLTQVKEKKLNYGTINGNKTVWVIHMTNKDNQSTKQELNLVPLVAIIAPIATILVVALPLLTG
jgi:hypothetical protein